MDMSVDVSEPAYVIVSQGQSSYWALDGAKTTSYVKFLNVSAFNVDEGSP